MKKELLTALLITFAVCSVGCSGDTAEESKNTAPESTQAVTEITEPATEPETCVPVETMRERNIESAEKFDYEIYDGKVIITKYKGDEEYVEIPAEVEGVPVGEIGFYCFEADNNLISVALPETVEIIGEGAFMCCPSLSQINMPLALREIQRGAFVDCTALTEMTIPETVTRVYEEAFTGCTGMTSLTIANPDLAYENWGIEPLENLLVYAPSGSAAEAWVSEMGKLG
ncbi:MAG: leucine-rich repeat domain-containing protein [Ruminococcus sp.]|nr:leucine-rich repeat domain-containing protein [Ruminococcus sp.]